MQQKGKYTMNDHEQPAQLPQEAAENAADAADGDEVPESAAAAATDASPTEKRRWMRHPVKRVFGGVCGGLADFLQVSEGLVRLLFLGLMFVTMGAGIALYLLFWLFLPVGTREEGQTAEPTISLRDKHGRWFGYGVIGIGLILLASNLGVFQWATNLASSVAHILLVPGLFILAGFLVLRRFHRRALRRDMQSLRSQVKTASGAARDWTGRASFGPGRLHRSKRDRVLLGVCGGLGETLSVDPLLMRLAWIVVTIMTGFFFMVALYLILAVALPAREPGTESDQAPTAEPPAPAAPAVTA